MRRWDPIAVPAVKEKLEKRYIQKKKNGTCERFGPIFQNSDNKDNNNDNMKDNNNDSHNDNDNDNNNDNNNYTRNHIKPNIIRSKPCKVIWV